MRLADHLFFSHFRQVLRCDTQPVGIVAEVAIFAKVALFEHDDERLHELMILRRDAVEAILSGMEIEKVEYHRLNGIDKHVAVEVMLWHGQPTVNLCKVVGTTLLLLWSKTHDGIVK